MNSLYMRGEGGMGYFRQTGEITSLNGRRCDNTQPLKDVNFSKIK